jgi:predicted nucleotidyltransferase component of viral defense system
LNDEPSLQDLLDVRAHFQLPSLALVRKDWHVVRAMRAIAVTDTTPFRLIFAGGTCLARAHRLVARMSEDVDFKIVSDESVSLSANRRRRQLGELRDRITAALQAAGFDLGPGDIRSRDANHYTVYNLRYAGPDGAGEHLRPTIQVELNHARLRRPAVTLSVTSFVAEAFARPPELPAVACVSTTETAAEKLISLTRRTAMELAGLSRAPDPNLVRHIYDLHAIHAHVDHAEAIDLIRSIAQSDAQEFGNQHPAYLNDIAGETHKALDALQSDPAIHSRYDAFLAAMVYGEPVAFDTALKTVSAWIDTAWPRQHHAI